MQAPEVLVFPRGIFGSAFSLMPWESIQPNLEEIEESFSWLHRPEAEESADVVQAIPCVLIKDKENKYCVFRRVMEDRPDMSKKLSLIIGGHIDEVSNIEGFKAAMSNNLMREIDEEIGIYPKNPPRPDWRDHRRFIDSCFTARGFSARDGCGRSFDKGPGRIQQSVQIHR